MPSSRIIFLNNPYLICCLGIFRRFIVILTRFVSAITLHVLFYSISNPLFGNGFCYCYFFLDTLYQHSDSKCRTPKANFPGSFIFIKRGSAITTLLERHHALQGNKAWLQREKSQNTRKVKMGGELRASIIILLFTERETFKNCIWMCLDTHSKHDDHKQNNRIMGINDI